MPVDPVALRKKIIGYLAAAGLLTNVNSVDQWQAVSKALSETFGTGGGAEWHVGAGAPSPILGAVGDFYLNSSNGDVYEKTLPGWGTPVCNITGPVGPIGPTGPAGPSNIIHETSGPTDLTVGAIVDGSVFTRSGATVVGKPIGTTINTIAAGSDIRFPAIGAHGWPRDASGNYLVSMSYSSTNKQVTIVALSGSTFDIWVKGAKQTISSPHVSVAHTATEGGWFYSHNGSAWVWSQVNWDLFQSSPACYVYWSSIGGAGKGFHELHNWSRPVDWHKEKHNSTGTDLISGGYIGSYTLDTDTDVALRLGVSECVIADEDIGHTLSVLNSGDNFAVWYRSGVDGYWTWLENNDLPLLYGTYARRNYDSGGGTGWTMADISGVGLGEYVSYYILATPCLDSAHRFILIPGQTAYTSLAAAQAEAPFSLSLGALPFQECVAIAQLVFHCRSIYGGSSKSRLESVRRLTAPRGSFSSAATSFPSHNALFGLQGGVAGERYHLTETENLLVAGATATPAPGVIPIADGSGSLSSWVTGAASYTLLYEVDFASLPNQTISADGAQTIDGKLCYAVNKANSQTFAVQNGSGLYIRCSTTNSANDASTLSGPIVYWNLYDLDIAMLKNQFGDVKIWFLANSVRTPAANYESFDAGCILGGATSATQSRVSALQQYVSSIGTATHYQNGLTKWNCTNTSTSGGTPSYTPPNTFDVFMVHITNAATAKVYYGASVGGAFPDEDDLIYSGRGSFTGTAGIPAEVGGHLRAYIDTYSVNTAGNADVLLKRMKILYK